MIYMFKGRLLCDSCTKKEKKKSMDANCINCLDIKSVDVLDLSYRTLAILENKKQLTDEIITEQTKKIKVVDY